MHSASSSPVATRAAATAPSAQVGPDHLGPSMDAQEFVARNQHAQEAGHAASMFQVPPAPPSLERSNSAMAPPARDAVAASAGNSSEREPLPLRTPGQQVALFHRAHAHLKCRSATPAIRVLALVEAPPAGQPLLSPQWSGTQTIRTLQQQHSQDLDIFMHPCFEPILIPRHQGALTPEKEKEKIDAILKHHHDQLERNKQEFTENVQKRQMGKTKKTPDGDANHTQQGAQQGGETDASTEADADAAERVVDTPVGVACEKRGQKLLVLSVVHDPDKEKNEPIITLYGAFDTEEDAKHYITHTLSKHVSDQDLFIHPAYEWIHLDPSAMEDKCIPCKYRDSTLDAIMRKHRTQSSEVESFIAQCKEANIEPTITEIDGKPHAENPITLTKLEDGDDTTEDGDGTTGAEAAEDGDAAA